MHDREEHDNEQARFTIATEARRRSNEHVEKPTRYPVGPCESASGVEPTDVVSQSAPEAPPGLNEPCDDWPVTSKPGCPPQALLLVHAASVARDAPSGVWRASSAAAPSRARNDVKPERALRRWFSGCRRVTQVPPMVVAPQPSLVRGRGPIFIALHNLHFPMAFRASLSRAQCISPHRVGSQGFLHSTSRP